MNDEMNPLSTCCWCGNTYDGSNYHPIQNSVCNNCSQRYGEFLDRQEISQDISRVNYIKFYSWVAIFIFTTLLEYLISLITSFFMFHFACLTICLCSFSYMVYCLLKRLKNGMNLVETYEQIEVRIANEQFLKEAEEELDKEFPTTLQIRR